MATMRIGRAELRVLDLEEVCKLLYEYYWLRGSWEKSRKGLP